MANVSRARENIIYLRDVRACCFFRVSLRARCLHFNVFFFCSAENGKCKCLHNKHDVLIRTTLYLCGEHTPTHTLTNNQISLVLKMYIHRIVNTNNNTSTPLRTSIWCSFTSTYELTVQLGCDAIRLYRYIVALRYSQSTIVCYSVPLPSKRMRRDDSNADAKWHADM